MAIAAMTEFHVARLETSLPLVDKHRLAAAGIERGERALGLERTGT